MQNKKTLVVIGGGAAGFFCAINAAIANPSLHIILLEKTSKLLGKVKVSGGGRCNVTHACFSISDLIKKYPRGAAFLKKAFHLFNTTDTINWFSERGISLHTEADGRMFPTTNSSQTIIDCLLNQASQLNIEIMMHAHAEAISHVTPYNFQIALNNQRTVAANYLCVACGGFPKSSQFDWLTAMGHRISDPVPSLFTFNIPNNNITSLMGVSVPVVSIKISGTKIQQEGPLLITHWGLSGPAILKTSAWGALVLAEMNYHFSVVVNWLPSYNENTLRDKMQFLRFDIATQKMVNRNPFGLPARLWEYLLQTSEIKEEIRWADLPAKEQNKLIKLLCAHTFDVKGKTTFKEEFVTAGGIVLSEIEPLTMQSKIVPGLYFAGEILDVDGVTGGFNFQNAWTTGWIAASSIAKDASLHQ